MKHIHTIGILAFVAATGLAACSDPGASLESGEAPGSVEQSISGPGTSDTGPRRPEVVDVGGCTATLIHRYFLLSSAHCGMWGPRAPAGHFAHFHLPRTEGSNLEVTIPIDRALELHGVATSLPLSSTPFQWAADLALYRLQQPAPDEVTPATLAMRDPYPGETCTTYGYGGWDTTPEHKCLQGGNGVERLREWVFPPTLNPEIGNGACGGDSGGPNFIGNALAHYELFATTLTHTGLGQIPLMSEEILEQIRLMKPDPSTGKFQNWVWGADRVGHDLPGYPVPTSGPASCQTTCLLNNACKAWTYASGWCYVKDQVERWIPSDAVNVATGARPRIEDGFKRNGDTWQVLTGWVTSALSCRLICGANNAYCSSFTYDPTAKVCTLYRNAPTPEPQAAGETKQSGLPASTGDGIGRGAVEYAIDNGSSAVDCRQKCAADYFCQSYSFHSSDATCHRYDGPGGLYGSTVETSGLRRRPSLPGVRFADGSQVIGIADHKVKALAGTSYVTIDLCAAECENDVNCYAYTARHHIPGEPIRCTLYAVVTGEVRVVDGDNPEVGLARQVTSGYRGDIFY